MEGYFKLPGTVKADLAAYKAETTAQLADKAPQIALDIEKARINNLVAVTNASFYEKSTAGITGVLLIVESGATTGQINLASVTPVATGYTAVAGDYVLLVYGVASGSAELIDLKIGADGITYGSAGEAVRGQIGKLKTNIGGEKDWTHLTGDYVLQTVPAISGARWSAMNSDLGHTLILLTSLLYYYYTEPIEVKAGDKFHIQVTGSRADLYHVIYLDEDSIFIGGECYGDGVWDVEITIPENCKYLEFNILANLSVYKYIYDRLATEKYVETNCVTFSDKSLTYQDPANRWNVGTQSVVDEMTTYLNSVKFDKDTFDVRYKMTTNFSHDSKLAIDAVNGLAYCCMLTNDVGTGDSPTYTDAYSILEIIDLDSWTLLGRHDAGKYGDAVGGFTIISGVGGATPIIIDGDITVTFCAKLSDNKWYMLRKVFDVATSTFGATAICQFTHEAATFDFTTDNISLNVFTLPSVDHFPNVGAQASKHTDGYYYCGLLFNSLIPNSILIRTLDFLTFEYWLEPQFVDSQANWEGSCFCKDGYLYYALRQISNSTEPFNTKILLSKINLTSKAIVEQIKIQDAGSKGYFFTDGTNIYLVHSTCARQRTEILKIDPSNLGNSSIVVQGTMQSVYPNIEAYNGYYYLLGTGNSSTSVYLRKFDLLPYANLDISNRVVSLFDIQ